MVVRGARGGVPVPPSCPVLGAATVLLFVRSWPAQQPERRWGRWVRAASSSGWTRLRAGGGFRGVRRVEQRGSRLARRLGHLRRPPVALAGRTVVVVDAVSPRGRPPGPLRVSGPGAAAWCGAPVMPATPPGHAAEVDELAYVRPQRFGAVGPTTPLRQTGTTRWPTCCRITAVGFAPVGGLATAPHQALRATVSTRPARRPDAAFAAGDPPQRRARARPGTRRHERRRRRATGAFCPRARSAATSSSPWPIRPIRHHTRAIIAPRPSAPAAVDARAAAITTRRPPQLALAGPRRATRRQLLVGRLVAGGHSRPQQHGAHRSSIAATLGRDQPLPPPSVPPQSPRPIIPHRTSPSRAAAASPRPRSPRGSVPHPRPSRPGAASGGRLAPPGPSSVEVQSSRARGTPGGHRLVRSGPAAPVAASPHGERSAWEQKASDKSPRGTRPAAEPLCGPSASVGPSSAPSVRRR